MPCLRAISLCILELTPEFILHKIKNSLSLSLSLPCQLCSVVANVGRGLQKLFRFFSSVHFFLSLFLLVRWAFYFLLLVNWLVAAQIITV
jgi:hypothetical protein